MRFHFEMTIDRPREEVWSSFDNVENLKKWQPTLESFDLQNGKPGQVGAESRLIYKENGRRIVMLETITGRREPESFSGTYATSMGKNSMWIGFEPIDGGKTRLVVDAEFGFKGPMMLVGPFMKGAVGRRMRTDLERFKTLLEAGQLAISRPPDPAPAAAAE